MLCHSHRVIDLILFLDLLDYAAFRPRYRSRSRSTWVSAQSHDDDVHFSRSGSVINVALSSHDVRGSLLHFWKSTGFCPPLPHENALSFDLSHDVQLNLAYIGAIPFGGIHQVRVHWLFELVKVEKITNYGPSYDFHFLDEFISLLAVNELVPGFELMGNPSGIFSDFENSTQVYWWRDLVQQVAQRYVDKYGIGFVKEWNFETWNEPNNHDFDNLTFSVQALQLFQAINLHSIIFHSASQHDNYSKRTTYTIPFFNHIIRGKNYFTGELGIRLDYMAFHEKGEGQGSVVLGKEMKVMQKIRSLFSELVNKPFFDDEADPLVGWSAPQIWRATTVYPAVVVKIIAQHQNMVIANSQRTIRNYTLLSNDNAFLSYYPYQFLQRTLLARFQINNTLPPYVTFIRKPIYSLISILALMGDEQVHVNAADASGEVIANNSNLVFWPLSMNQSNPLYNQTDLKMMIYNIYNDGLSPFEIWSNKFHSVPFPSLDEMAQIRQHEDPRGELYDIPVRKGVILFPSTLTLKDPHFLFMHLCGKAEAAPEKVNGVRFMKVTYGQVMVVWSDDSIVTRCLSTYEVELSTTNSSGPYARVNKWNSIISSFLFESVSGESPTTCLVMFSQDLRDLKKQHKTDF